VNGRSNAGSVGRTVLLLALIVGQTGAHCGRPVFAPHVRSHHAGAHGADAAPTHSAGVQAAGSDCLSAVPVFEVNRGGAVGPIDAPPPGGRSSITPPPGMSPRLSRPRPTASPPLPLRI
jgi:hypothetical protein